MADLEQDDDPAEMPYRRFGIPKLGFENYWYPIVTTRKVKRKPLAVRLLDGTRLKGLRPPAALRARGRRRERRLGGVRFSVWQRRDSIPTPADGWPGTGERVNR